MKCGGVLGYVQYFLIYAANENKSVESATICHRKEKAASVMTKTAEKGGSKV